VRVEPDHAEVDARALQPGADRSRDTVATLVDGLLV
jgi:hypothetical protein